MTLSLQQVAKAVGGETHIAPVDLTLETGSLNVLLGLTLAGKTTLMRLMAGLDKPDSGKVLENERDVTGVAVQKRDVAMVYQQFINYPSLTVYENIASPLRLARINASEIDRRVRTEAERLNIEGFLGRLPAELSGGQQQRTAMARALVRDARLILLDEPLVNLDYKLREALRSDLPRVFAGRDSIVVYATTDPWEALSLGGRTIVLQEGRLLQTGSAPEVYAAPVTTHVASVFSDPPMNLIEGEKNGDHVVFGEDSVASVPRHLSELQDSRYIFGLRPDHLELRERSDQDWQMRAVVDVAEISGSETFIHFILYGKPWVAMEYGVKEIEPGQEVNLGFDAARLFAFDTHGQLLVSPERGSHAGHAAQGVANGAH